jgi:hypothetical protein
VKHAFALRTAVHRRPEWIGKRPVLFYLYAEPTNWPGGGGSVPLEDRVQHREEVAAFSEMVAGDEVSFRSCTYAGLLWGWAAAPNPLVWQHAGAVIRRFLA